MATSAGELTFTINVDASQMLTAQRTVTVSVNNMSSNINTLTTSTNNAAGGFNRLSTSVAASASPLNRVSSLVAGISAALATDRIIAYADAWTTVGNKVTNYLKTGQNLVDVQESLYKVANDTRTPLSAVATLYGRLEPATRGIISSGSELLKITDTINKAFVVSGATGDEATYAILQLSQALGMGALRSEEFNSVNEQAPRIMQGIADSMGVARGELKTLAGQGKITTDVVIKAIQDMSASVDTEFSKMNATFGQKGTIALNNLTKAFGESNGVQSAVSLLGDALIGLSSNIGNIATTAGALATLMLARFAGSMYASAAASLKSASATIASSEANVIAAQAVVRKAIADKEAALSATALAQAELNVARGSSAEMFAITALTAAKTASRAATITLIEAEAGLATAQASASIASRGLGVAMSALGGPAGIITIAAIGVYALVSAMKSGSETAIDYSGNIDTVTASLKKMNREQAAAEGVKLQAKITEQQQSVAEATQQAIIAQQRLNYLRKNGADTASQQDEVTLALGKQADEQQKLNNLMEGQEEVRKRLNTQEEKGAKTQNDKKGVSANAQKIIDDLNARTEAEKAYGTAQSARIMAEKEAKDAGVTDPNEIKLIQDKAAALWETTNARKEATKESEAAESAAKKDESAQQQVTDKMSDTASKAAQLGIEYNNLKKGIDDNSAATSRFAIESATLEAQRQLGAAATKEQIEAQAANILKIHEETAAIDKLKKKQAEDVQTTQRFETVESKTKTKGQSVDDQYKEDLKALNNYYKMTGKADNRYLKTKAKLEEKYRKDKQAAAIEDYKAQSEWNTFLMDGLDALGQSATTTIAGLASGTMTATEAMQNFANIILNQAVGALVSMGIEALKNQIVGQTAAAASVMAAEGTAAAITSAYAPAAFMANTATMGGAGITGLEGLQSGVVAAKALGVAGGRQFGGSVNAGGMYRVGENGRAEVFTQGGRNYLLPGDGGGQVTPMSGMGGGGFSQQVNITNTAGANVSTNSSADGKQLNIMIDQRVSQSIRKKQGLISRSFRDATNTTWRAR